MKKNNQSPISSQNWGMSVHLLKERPKRKDFATLLSERTTQDLLNKITTMNQRAVSIQKERLEKMMLRQSKKQPDKSDNLDENMNGLKSNIATTAADTLLPSIGASPYIDSQRQNEILPSVESRIKATKTSIITEATLLSQPPEREKEEKPKTRKLPFSQFYQDESGKIRNYFGYDKNEELTPRRNLGQSYAKKLGKMIITKKSGGRLSEQKWEREEKEQTD